MKATKSGAAKSEGELHALFNYECARSGGPFQAYGAIVAAGRSGATLHYNSNKGPLPSHPGDLLLIDAGCEYMCYASDITRCFPVGGKFEGEWKVVYEIVLDMQIAVLNAIKPGVKWEEMHRLAEKVALEGLVKVFHPGKLFYVF
jgi:Xaa-Pro dipeptidase